MFWKKGLLVIIAFALLVVVGRSVAAESTNANTSDKESVRRAKIAVGSNANVTVTASDGMASTVPLTIEFVEVRLSALDAAGMNMMDDGMLEASAGANEEIAVEVFAGDVDGGLGGASIVFTVDPASAAMITGFAPAEGMTLLGISGNQVDVGAEEAVMLSNGGFLGTLKLMTGAEVVPFTVGVELFRAVLASGEETMLMLPAPVLYNSPDFDSDGTVGIPDFLLFVDRFGTSRGDAGYDTKYDLDNNGAIGIPDFLIFVNNFGSEVSPSGGGGGGGGSPTVVTIPDANRPPVSLQNTRKAFVDADGNPIFIVKLDRHGAMTPLTVDFEDFVAFTMAFNTDATHENWRVFVQADMNDDGMVNFDDFVLFFGSYGKEAQGPAG